jgi:hypothetical protein
MARHVDYPEVAVGALGRLKEASAFRALPPDERRQLRHDTVKIARYLTRRRGERRPPESQAPLVDDVDFPAFVADLVKGVFGAIVDSSIRQMEAYGDLLKDVAKSIDEFAKDDDATCLERHRQTVAIAVLVGVKRISRSRGD